MKEVKEVNRAKDIFCFNPLCPGKLRRFVNEETKYLHMMCGEWKADLSGDVFQPIREQINIQNLKMEAKI